MDYRKKCQDMGLFYKKTYSHLNVPYKKGD